MPDTQPIAHCPACGSAAQPRDALFEAPLLGATCRVRKCADCGLVYKDRVPGAAALAALYSDAYVHFAADSPPGRQEIDGARIKLARAAALVASAPPAKLRVLDVGCGRGTFVAIARDLGYDAHGIDPHLPAALASSYLRRGTPAELEPGAFDVALMLNVAEHVPQPRPLFESVRRVLAPGGALLVTCPYGDSLARRAWRARWVHLALDEHLLFWTPASLRRLARATGFAGRESYRIAGSPFPFGRVPDAPARGNATAAPASPPSLQARAWSAARRLQAHAAAARWARRVVHATRSGDYLEYAIGAGD
jgi:2-polyprenyl-3-methyl-5-hydroxy-6-metoxy-1,4-benzoquinol methylase